MIIETHTADRKSLTQAIADELHVPVRYLGTPSYGYQAGAYTIDRNGAIHGEDLTPLRDFLLRNGYIAEDTALNDSETYDTVHEIGDGQYRVTINLQLEADEQPQTLINFLRMLYARQDLLAAMTRCSTPKLDEEVITLLSDLKPDTIEKIAELLQKETEIGMATGITLQPGKLSVTLDSDTGRDGAWLSWREVLVRMLRTARQANRVNATRITPAAGEMKYFCRSWLIQLRMGGADFKAARQALLGHLPGYAAFRTADKMREHKAKYRHPKDTSRAQNSMGPIGTADLKDAMKRNGNADLKESEAYTDEQD